MSDGTDKWVAFVGGGFDSTFANYDSGSKVSEAFFVIDLVHRRQALGISTTRPVRTDDRQYMNFSVPASPTAVDLNGDGYIDRVYIADVGGQIWKFDVAPTRRHHRCWRPGRTNSGRANDCLPRHQAKQIRRSRESIYPTQAMFTPPTLAYDANGNLWMFIGTGDRYHPNNTSSNRFYGIKENTTMTNGSDFDGIQFDQSKLWHRYRDPRLVCADGQQRKGTSIVGCV